MKCQILVTKLPSLVTQTQMSAFVEEDSDILIGKLVAKTIFVGVVHPLGHPDKRFRLCDTWSVPRCWKTKKNPNINFLIITLRYRHVYQKASIGYYKCE